MGKRKQRIVLLVPSANTGTWTPIAYGYEPQSTHSASDTGRFYRETTDNDQTNQVWRETLLAPVTADFTFARYRLAAGAGPDQPATNNLETRLLEVRLRAVRTNPAGAPLAQAATSVRAVLRNKATTP